MKGAVCTKRTATSEWDAISNYHTYVCDDLEWTCSCLFSASTKLPCRHLLLVARDGLEFEELPESAIHLRWSVRAATQLYEDIDDGIIGILPVLDAVKLKPRSEESDDVAPLKPSAPLKHTKKDVTFVQLKRNEQADLPVLAFNENYRFALATPEPLLDHLSSLSSEQFYVHLENWEKMLSLGLQTKDDGKKVDTDTEDGDKVYESDSDIVEAFNLDSEWTMSKRSRRLAKIVTPVTSRTHILRKYPFQRSISLMHHKN